MTDTPAAAMRSRPEVPNFDFASKKDTAGGPCSRCGSIVEQKDAFCPQCGASLLACGSPIADAAHNSIPPNELERAKLQAAGVRGDARGQDTPVHHAVCSRCGVNVIPGARNCPQCGTRLDVSANEGPGGPTSAIPGAAAEFAPASGARLHESIGRLVMLAQDGSIQRSITLSGERIDLGRTAGEIQLDQDNFLSERHARFMVRNGAVILTDLMSLNGIYLKLRDAVSLSDGDMFLVGLQLLEFRTESPELANLDPIQVGGCSLFGSSTSPRYARLSERTNDGVPRSVFVIGRDETILGREVGDIVFSGDPFMSRRHASLTRNPADGTFSLRDLGSSNGTFLRVRGKVDLQPGDHLRIGQHLFRYEMATP